MGKVLLCYNVLHTLGWSGLLLLLIFYHSPHAVAVPTIWNYLLTMHLLMLLDLIPPLVGATRSAMAPLVLQLFVRSFFTFLILRHASEVIATLVWGGYPHLHSLEHYRNYSLQLLRGLGCLQTSSLPFAVAAIFGVHSGVSARWAG